MTSFAPYQITLNTVYESLTSRVINTTQSRGTSPTFEVSGVNSSVNVYVSNKVNKPIDKTEMTLDSNSPFAEDSYKIEGQVKWILFEQNQGLSVVNTINLVVVT